MRTKRRAVVTPNQTPGTKPNYEPGKKPPKIWKGGPKVGPKHYGQGGKKPGPQVGTNDPGVAKKKPKGRSGGSGGGGYGAYGDFAGVNYGDAKANVNAALKPEIHQVQNDIQKQRRETQLERQRAKRQYNAAVGDIGHIYGETGDYINYQNQGIEQNFGNLTDQTQVAQQALMTHLQGTGTAAQSEVNAETERLGIQGMNYTAPMQQDQAFTTEQAQISGANNMANLNLSHQNTQELGNLLVGMNAGSQTAAYGRAANAKSDALFEAQANKHTAVEQLRRGLQDLRSQRPDLIRQMQEQMLQSRWGQYMDTQNMDLQRDQLSLQRAAQRAYNKRADAQAASWNNRSSSYSSGGGSSSSGGSATGDGAGGDGGGGLGTPYANEVMNVPGFSKPTRPPRKPGKKKH